MRSRKVMSSSRPGQQYCHANVAFCPHLENIIPPILLPLSWAQSLSPPSCCWVSLLSHTHPYYLIFIQISPTNYHSTICLRLALILQKKVSSSHLHHVLSTCEGGREIRHPRAETSTMPRGTSARPPPQAETSTNTPSESFQCTFSLVEALPAKKTPLSSHFFPFHTLC